MSAGNGADVLLRALVEHAAIDVVFANPGTTEMQLVSALDDLHPNASKSSGAGVKNRAKGAILPVLCLHEVCRCSRPQNTGSTEVPLQIGTSFLPAAVHGVTQRV